MRNVAILTSCLGLALAACQTLAPLREPLHPTAQLVERQRDVARVLAALRQRGIEVLPRDVSKVEALQDAPGYAYMVGAEWLHLHAYADAAAAGRARARFVEGVPHAVISWVGQPNIFQCGTAVAIYFGQAEEPLAALTTTCGPAARPRG